MIFLGKNSPLNSVADRQTVGDLLYHINGALCQNLGLKHSKQKLDLCLSMHQDWICNLMVWHKQTDKMSNRTLANKLMAATVTDCWYAAPPLICLEDDFNIKTSCVTLGDCTCIPVNPFCVHLREGIIVKPWKVQLFRRLCFGFVYMTQVSPWVHL